MKLTMKLVGGMVLAAALTLCATVNAQTSLRLPDAPLVDLTTNNAFVVSDPMTATRLGRVSHTNLSSFVRTIVMTNSVFYNATFNVGTYANAFGDSIMADGAPTYSTNAMAMVIGAKKGWTVNNQAIAAKELADLIELNIYTNVIKTNSISFALLGYNDMRHLGTNAVDLANFKSGLMSVGVYLTTPRERMVIGQSTNVTYTGSWVNTPAWGTTLGKFTPDTGGTATFTLRGSVIYVDILRQNSAANRPLNVKVDGVDYGSFGGADFRGTIGNVTHIPTLVRIANLADTAHTVVLTVLGSSGNAFFNWAASAPRASQTIPAFYLGNCLRMNTAGYALGGAPWIKGSDAAVASFNAAIEDVARTLSNDGLNIAYVDASAAHDLTTDISGDGVHPNDSGHLHIADAFLGAMNNAPYIAGRGVKKPVGVSVTEDVLTVGSTTNRHVFVNGVLISNIVNYHN